MSDLEKSPFEVGFERRMTYGGFNKLAKEIDPETARRYTGQDYVSASWIESDDITDEVWLDAEENNPVALMFLGRVARNEVQSAYDYEAIPGYDDPVVMPQYPYIKPITVMEFEIELLQVENRRYKNTVVTTSKAKLRQDKKLEATPFEKAEPRNQPRNIIK
jgi:hypothetical protein